MTLLPRVFGAIAGALASWLELLLADWLGITVSAEEHQWLVGIIVLGILTAYQLTHRYVSSRLNPKDLAAK